MYTNLGSWGYFSVQCCSCFNWKSRLTLKHFKSLFFREMLQVLTRNIVHCVGCIQFSRHSVLAWEMEYYLTSAKLLTVISHSHFVWNWCKLWYFEKCVQNVWFQSYYWNCFFYNQEAFVICKKFEDVGNKYVDPINWWLCLECNLLWWLVGVPHQYDSYRRLVV